jgi:hypothetical protein
MLIPELVYELGRDLGSLVPDLVDDPDPPDPATWGTIWFANEFGVATRLEPDDGKVLTSHGPGADPTWELAGAASLPSLEDEGTPVAGGPFDTYNFVGAGVTVTDGGSGVATITVGAGSGAADLQEAYDDGAGTIVATAAKAIAFSNAVDATDLLTLTRTFAGAGEALDITMAAAATGWGIRVGHADIQNTFKRAGVWIENPTAATAGVQNQYSPALMLRANAWLPTLSQSEPVEFSIHVTTAGSGTQANGKLEFLSGDGAMGVPSNRIFYLDGTGGGAAFVENRYGFQDANGLIIATSLLTLQTGSAELEWTTAGTLLPGTNAASIGATASVDRWPYFYGKHLDIAQNGDATGVPPNMVKEVAGAHNSVNNAEHTDVLVDLTSILTFDGHATVTQNIASLRSYRIRPRTYTATLGGGDPESGNGGVRVTKAATLAIEGAPIDGGTHYSQDNAYALWVESGKTQLDGALGVTGASVLAALSATTGTFSGQVLGPAGSAATPSFAASQTNKGMYSDGTDILGFATAGTRVMRLSADGRIRIDSDGTAANPTIAIGGDTTSGWYSPAANEHALSCSSSQIMKWAAAAVTASVQIIGPSGTAAAPSFAPGDGNDGMYAIAGNALGFSTAGAVRVGIDANGILLYTDGSAATASLSWNGDTDTGLFHETNVLGITAGAAEMMRFADAGIKASRNAYGAPVALTDGATVNIDASDSNKFTWTAAASRALANATGAVAGMEWQILYRQNGTGGWTINYGTEYVGPGNTDPDTTCQPDGTANAYTVISFQAISASKVMVSISDFYL